MIDFDYKTKTVRIHIYIDVERERLLALTPSYLLFTIDYSCFKKEAMFFATCTLSKSDT